MPSGRVRPCSCLRERIVPQHLIFVRRNPWRTHLSSIIRCSASLANIPSG